MKCVIVVDETLPIGLLTNTAAALALSLGNHVSGLIGPDVADGDGRMHKGITAVPIPILAANQAAIQDLLSKSQGATESGLTVLGFSDVAQSCKHYDEYIEKMKAAKADDIDYLGLCLYGPRKKVSSLCGQMKLLR